MYFKACLRIIVGTAVGFKNLKREEVKMCLNHIMSHCYPKVFFFGPSKLLYVSRLF